MSALDDATHERRKVGVRQKITREEKRGVRLMPRQFVQDRLAAVRKGMASERKCNLFLIRRAADDAALAQLKVRGRPLPCVRYDT